MLATTTPRRSTLFILLALLFTASAAHAQPTISKVFTPNTIGPGSVSTITFTITNGAGAPVTDLAFTDNLPTVPGNLLVAAAPNITSDCGTGTVTAVAGSGTITFSDGQVGGSQSCTITVDVTAGTVGVHTNPAITLTSSAGSEMSLPTDLIVFSGLPGFSKSFAPSSVPLGDKTTLTFTIDNTLNAAPIGNLEFTDTLPAGIVVADPSNAATDCVAASAPDTTVTAVPGSSFIELDANGSSLFAGFEVLPAGATCTATVDVVSIGVGTQVNVTGNLLADFTGAGKASATLDVTRTDLAIQKAFVDDPVPPGNTVELEFTIANFDRTSSATGVAFTDDLTTVLTGLTFDSLVSNTCGGSVSGVGGTTIGLSGGTIAAEGSCTIRVSLSVPAGATPGSYPNTTSAVTATVGSSPVVGNMASDDLFVESVPLITKTYVGSPADPGGTIQLDFTITNTSTTSSATDIAFMDLFDTVTQTASVTPANGCCGAGSICSFTPLIMGTNVIPATLSISNGTLAPAGMADDSCTFSITLDVVADAPPGIYPNTTTEITATVDGATRTGEPASDSFTVIAAPPLTKAFNDPVAPGDTVTLDFILQYPAEASGDATGITFTDDLSTVLAGLVGTGLPIAEACDPDGPGGDPGTGTLSGSAGDTLLTFAGGTLSPGETCTISVDLTVPAGAASGNFTNTTSGVAATVGGSPATSAAASDVLNVSGLVFTKEFTEDPALPGDFTNLRFTIENIHPTDDATGIVFTDNLGATLSGLIAFGGPTMDTCGGSLTGTSFVIYTGGSVTSGSSCIIEVDLLVPAGAADGDYNNTTSNLTATQSGGPVVADPAVDVLTVNSSLLQLDKAFTDDPVAPGDPVTLEFTLTNLDGANAASAIAFTDDLNATLAGLTFDSILLDDCGGTVMGTGTNLITVSGASLAAGGTCTLRVSLTVPGGAAAGTYPNTTSDVTGTISGFPVDGDPGLDDLEVVQLLTFSKSFDGPTTATGTAVLTFTITNPGSDTANGISFTDDLNAVIPGLIAIGLPAVPCGDGSSITGIGFLTFSGGTLPPAGGTCSFDVDVLVPVSATAGTFPNTTSDLFRAGLVVSDPATADLTIEPAPTFEKTFSPDFIGFGATSTLTFDIDNTASALAANSLAFSDTLPAGVVVATPAVTSNTCGGTLSATAGAGVISLTGGSVGAGASCAISVDVSASATGSFVNLTGDLTSTSGNSGTATDTLTVNPQPGFVKVFSPDPILVGGTSTLTFTIDNSASTVAASLLAFVDTLPTEIVLATPVNAVNTCGGTLTAVDGGTSVTLSGGTAAIGAVCTISVDVTSSTPGTHTNLTGDLTSSLGNSGTATDTLTVNPPPTFAKSFAPDPIIFGATSTLTFTIDNTASTVAATSLAFSDTLPTEIVVTTPANNVNGCGGTLTATAGSNSITLAGGSVAASSSCTITVDVTSSTAGTFTNLTGDLTSSSGNSGTATDTLTVNPPPGFSKAFAPNPIASGDTSTLTFTIDNTGSTVDATAVAFSDTMPTEITVASPANVVNGCGGTVTATSGTNVISLAGGSVTTGASCTLAVDVTSSTAGDYVNLTGDLTSSLGNSGTATDSLRVNPQPGFSKAFAPNPIAVGGTSTLTFTVDNTGSTVDATSLAFSDTMPTEITVASPANVVNGCGGTVTATSGTSVITLAGGTATLGASCTVAVDVTSSTAGAHTNTSGDLTSSLGNSGTASDTLTVNPPPGFSKAFAPDMIASGATSTLTFTIDNSSSTADATSLAFSDTMPTEITVASPANVVNGCGGTVTATSGTNVISLAGGTATLGASCTVAVDVTSSTPGSHVNTSGDLTSSLGNSGTASDTLTVAPPPGFSKAFAPNPILVNATSTLTLTIDNSASTLDASSLDFLDSLPAGLVVATPANAATTCTGGTVTATAGTGIVSYSGGTVSASSSCTVSADVTSASAGSYANTSGDLTSSLGNSGTASDTLVVNMAPTFSKAFAPNPILEGGVSTLTFTIDNSTSTLDATSLDFSDTMPAAIVVATPANVVNACTGGTVTAAEGGSDISYTGGTVSASSSCTISVDVTSSTPGDHVNTTGDLTSSLGNSGTASDTLTVNPPPTFSKAFAPTPIVIDGISTLTFTIDNTASTVDATSLDFSDTMPTEIVVATPANVVNGCTGGTVTAAEGGSDISYTGGTVSASSSCTISVDVTSGVPGSHVNTTGDLTSSSGNSGTATDTLVVEPPPTFAKAFSPNPILGGTVSTLTFTIDNSASTTAADSLDFTDTMPAAIIVATPPNVVNSCTGGTVTAAAATSVISYTGGTVAAAASCTISVDVTSSVTGSHVNVTGDLTSTSGNSGTATDTLVVNMAPTFSKVFSPNPTTTSGTSTLTFTIDNSTSTVDATGLDFVDNLPAGLVVATPGNAVNGCVGGTLTAADGSGSITYTGGTVSAMTSCTISVDVSAAVSGTYVNVTGDLTSSSGNSGTATDTLTVNAAPAFSKAFSPNPIGAGGTSTLTLTIDNSTSTLDATGLDFTDPLPAGLVVATPGNASTTCTGGTLTAADGSGSITYTGGTVGAMASCTISVDVTAVVAGDYVNVTGELTSSLGSSGTATATLNVVNGELMMTKTFTAGPILPGGLVDLEYTISNASPLFTATGITFMDDLDSALPGLVAVGLPPATPEGGDPCGAGSTVTGTSVITLAGGMLAPDTSCTFAVTLQVPADAADGSYTSTSGNVSADLSGVVVVGPPASADLTVAFLEFSKAFFGEAIPGGFLELEFTISNPDPVNPVTDITFTDDLDAVLPGLEAIDLPMADVCGAGSDVSGTSLILLLGGSLDPGGSCTFAVTLQVPENAPDGTFTNVTSVLEASVGGLAVVGDPAGAAMADFAVTNVLAIPTLDQWGLILLIALLAVAAVRRLHVG